MSGRNGLISVALAGPWWTELTYETTMRTPDCRPGVRVRVPVGKGSRIGLVTAVGGEDRPGAYDGKLKAILETVDETPLIDDTTLALLRWFCDMHLCGMGTAMKTLLPASFLRGEAFDLGRGGRKRDGEPVDTDTARDELLPAAPADASTASFVYEPADDARFARYADLLRSPGRSLVLFPLYASAQAFYDFLQRSSALSDASKRRIVLYPRSGAKAEWQAWSRLSLVGGTEIVVGGQAAATAPLPGLSRIVVDDESNNIWRTMRPPVHNVRSLAAKRAQLAGAAFVMGGRMPSSRAYLHLAGTGDPGRAVRSVPRGDKPVFFVDLKLAYAPSVKGVCDTLAVSEPLVRETEAALARETWAVWILDRKGYAGEIVCDECGKSLSCDRCGGTMRWEASGERVRCIVCGATGPVPDACPNCKGKLLTARRPGLEALLPLARAAVQAPVPILSLDDDDEERLREMTKRPAGLLVGTRAALSLCDAMNVGLIGWLDADGEARSQEYDARVRAFGLIWESCWRGMGAETRRVLLQTRRPGREWQKGLDDPALGWRTFWRREMAERRDFGMPPFLSLVKIEIGASDAEALSEALGEAAFEYWIADGEASKRRVVWVRTKKLVELRRILERFFHIGRAKRGYPAVTVWHD